MPSLPPLDLKTNINHAPHVVVLGAGASVAACPSGDREGKRLPVMDSIVSMLGLEPLLQEHKVAYVNKNFETLYDELVSGNANASLVSELQDCLRSYFLSLHLPDEVTLYDLLLVSLREKDLIATFNWDPFLAQAYKRNAVLKRLPRIVFLHGNVDIGVCIKHQVKGYITQLCSTCGERLTPSDLLYPVAHKNYSADPFIHSEWEEFRGYIREAYLLTIFGYRAPRTDAEARATMLKEWKSNPFRDLAEIELVDIRPRQELEKSWRQFFVRNHYGVSQDARRTISFRYARRSCESFAMATLQQAPWKENPLPNTKDLAELHEWLRPLLAEEADGLLSGRPCNQP